jgi:hypothetical protein
MQKLQNIKKMMRRNINLENCRSIPERYYKSFTLHEQSLSPTELPNSQYLQKIVSNNSNDVHDIYGLFGSK